MYQVWSLKDIDSRVFTRMLRKDGSVTMSLRNFVGEGIIKYIITKYRERERKKEKCLNHKIKLTSTYLYPFVLGSAYISGLGINESSLVELT